MRNWSPIFKQGDTVKETSLLFKEEVYRIIGAAIEVHRELGPGFLEAVYHEALEIEFTARNIPFESHKKLTPKYKKKSLKKKYEADFVCFHSIIVEIKVEERLTSKDQTILLNYLEAEELRVGVLINFGAHPTLEWRRFVCG